MHSSARYPGLLLGTEAPIMMPNGVDFAFQSFPTIIHSSILPSAVAFAGCNSYFSFLSPSRQLLLLLGPWVSTAQQWGSAVGLKGGLVPTSAEGVCKPCSVKQESRPNALPSIQHSFSGVHQPLQSETSSRGFNSWIFGLTSYGSKCGHQSRVTDMCTLGL